MVGALHLQTSSGVVLGGLTVARTQAPMGVKRDVSSFSVPPGRSPALLGSAVLRTPSAVLPGSFLRSQKKPPPLGGWRGLNTRTKRSSEGEDICQLDQAPVARHKPHGLKGPKWDPSLASYKPWKSPSKRKRGLPSRGGWPPRGDTVPIWSSFPAPSLCHRPGEDPPQHSSPGGVSVFCIYL